MFCLEATKVIMDVDAKTAAGYIHGLLKALASDEAKNLISKEDRKTVEKLLEKTKEQQAEARENRRIIRKHYGGPSGGGGGGGRPPMYIGDKSFSSADAFSFCTNDEMNEVSPTSCRSMTSGRRVRASSTW